jgi:hypothetical protein
MPYVLMRALSTDKDTVYQLFQPHSYGLVSEGVYDKRDGCRRDLPLCGVS